MSQQRAHSPLSTRKVTQEMIHSHRPFPSPHNHTEVMMCDVNIMGKGDTMIHNSSASVRMIIERDSDDPSYHSSIFHCKLPLVKYHPSLAGQLPAWNCDRSNTFSIFPPSDRMKWVTSINHGSIVQVGTLFGQH